MLRIKYIKNTDGTYSIQVPNGPNLHIQSKNLTQTQSFVKERLLGHIVNKTINAKLIKQEINYNTCSFANPIINLVRNHYDMGMTPIDTNKGVLYPSLVNYINKIAIVITDNWLKKERIKLSNAQSTLKSWHFYIIFNNPNDMPSDSKVTNKLLARRHNITIIDVDTLITLSADINNNGW